MLRSVTNRLLLPLAAAMGCAAMWWVGWLVGFPLNRGFNASLLLQGAPVAKLLVVALAIGVLTALCTLLAGRVRYDAGWACVALGLYALRLRGGPIATTINDHPPGVFLVLALELALLGALLGVAWVFLTRLRERGATSARIGRVLELPDASARQADRKAAAESLDQKLLATLIGAGSMAVFMMILCRNGERAQTFFAVGISAYLAVWIAHSFIPTRPAIIFWTIPIVCGLLGYLWAWFATPAQLLAIGQPGGFLAPLARPLPLDYASIGVAVALWRYVQSRNHQTQRALEANREALSRPSPVPG